jgi:superkiller protein 3
MKKSIIFKSIIFLIAVGMLFSITTFFGGLMKRDLSIFAIIPSAILLIWLIISILQSMREEEEAQKIKSERKLQKLEDEKSKKDAGYYHRLRMLGNHLEKDPTNVDVRLEIATIYHFQAKNETMALKHYKKVLAMNPPENTRTLVKKRIEQLKELYGDAEGPISYEVSDDELQGSLYYNPKDEDEIAREREESQIDASLMNPQTPQEYLEVAKTLFDEARINMIQRAIQLDYEFVDAHIALGQAYIDIGEFEEATRALNEAIELDENNEMAYIVMAKAYEELEYWDDAIVCYKTILQLNSKNSNALVKLGNAYLKKGNLAQAITIYQTVTQKDPNNYQAFYQLGQVLEKKGSPEKALLAYNKAVKLNPDSPESSEIYNTMGNIFKKKEKLDAALKAYQNAMRVDPEYPFSYYNIASLFEEVGKKEEAITFYQRFIDIARYDFPDHVEMVERRLETGLEMKKPKAAQVLTGENLSAKQLFLKAKKTEGAEKIVLLKKALKSDPDFFVAEYELGNCYRSYGNLPKAIETYKDVIKKAPKFAMAYNSLGELFVHYGQTEKAKLLFKKTLQINPTHPLAKNNLQKLEEGNL